MTNNKQQTEMNKEFIPYELAFELKQLGFDEPCFGWFRNTEFTISFNDLYPKERGEEIKIIAAPTYSQAFRWFRDKHNLHHMLNPFNRVEIIERDLVEFISFGYAIQDKVVGRTDFKTHEEAELACLKKLIEIANEQQ